MEHLKHKIISIESLSEIAVNIFRQHEEIVLAYLYGSYALRSQTQFSDIDIGLVLKEDFKVPLLYFAQISSKIEKQFDYSIEIDIRILNNSTPRFLFQVVKNGIVIYSKDDNIRDEYLLKVIHEYLDIKPMLDLFDNIAIKEALKNESKS